MTMHATTLDAEQIALIGRALSHPARIRILQLLAAQSECRGAEVFSELPLAQSTISEHLRVLKDAGLVTSHPVGTAMTYCLSRGPMQGFLESITALADAPTCGSNG
jgi:ArsR family transcriptional regulator